MVEVDTLFVLSTVRDSYAVLDLLNSIEYFTTPATAYTVVVDGAGELSSLPQPNRRTVIHSVLDTLEPSYHRAMGVQWAIDNGIVFKQAILLSDTCLVCDGGLDQFFLPKLTKDGVGMLGVGARESYSDHWTAAVSAFYQAGLQVDGWSSPPPAMVDDCLLLSSAFVGAARKQSLLVPDAGVAWPVGVGTYLSWVCHLIGFHAVSWGYADKCLPPLYVNYAAGSYLPPPHLLANIFLYSSVRNMLAYSESDIREMYKARRGEPARPVPRLAPVVTGPQVLDP